MPALPLYFGQAIDEKEFALGWDILKVSPIPDLNDFKGGIWDFLN